MQLEWPSFFTGIAVAIGLMVAYEFGQQKMTRHIRRIWRHGRNLDQVFFEDAERDVTIERPKPTKAETYDFKESQR